MKWFAALWIVILLILHQDFWLWTNKTLVLGFLPVGLVYHAAYAVVASLTMWMLVKVAWPKEQDAIDGNDNDDEHVVTRGVMQDVTQKVTQNATQNVTKGTRS